MGLTYKDVSEILKIIDSSNCEELVLELEGLRLVVRRGGQAAAMAAPMPTAALAPVRDGTITANAGTPARPPTRADDEARGEPGRIVLRAPMVGTFYRRPSPQEPPFVNVGSQIKKGDPLCLIEVMKLYTTIEAPADGVIELIGADDAALVEFDQLLFAIRPA